MDIAATLVNYLDGATSIEWFHDAPRDAPDEFGTVQRNGGPYSDYVVDRPTVTLITYGTTRHRAAELALEAKQALMAAPYAIDNIFAAEILGDYHDPLDGKQRHRITASLTTND